LLEDQERQCAVVFGYLEKKEFKAPVRYRKATVEIGASLVALNSVSAFTRRKYVEAGELV
jgi:hypothetical protein